MHQRGMLEIKESGSSLGGDHPSGIGGMFQSGSLAGGLSQATHLTIPIESTKWTRLSRKTQIAILDELGMLKQEGK